MTNNSEKFESNISVIKRFESSFKAFNFFTPKEINELERSFPKGSKNANNKEQFDAIKSFKRERLEADIENIPSLCTKLEMFANAAKNNADIEALIKYLNIVDEMESSELNKFRLVACGIELGIIMQGVIKDETPHPETLKMKNGEGVSEAEISKVGLKSHPKIKGSKGGKAKATSDNEKAESYFKEIERIKDEICKIETLDNNWELSKRIAAQMRELKKEFASLKSKRIVPSEKAKVNADNIEPSKKIIGKFDCDSATRNYVYEVLKQSRSIKVSEAYFNK